MIFTSPSKGNTSFEGMFQDIVGFIKESPQSTYKLIIGSDSHIKDEVCFVTAVILHRVGKGGRYFYTRSKYRKMGSLRQRIFYETALSLNVASQLAERVRIITALAPALRRLQRRLRLTIASPSAASGCDAPSATARFTLPSSTHSSVSRSLSGWVS